MRATLHSLISRSTGAFGSGPADIVERTLPLTGPAVQAVGRIGRLNLIVHSFINASRAERNTGAVEPRCAFSPANITVQNGQM